MQRTSLVFNNWHVGDWMYSGRHILPLQTPYFQCHITATLRQGKCTYVMLINIWISEKGNTLLSLFAADNRAPSAWSVPSFPCTTHTPSPDSIKHFPILLTPTRHQAEGLSTAGTPPWFPVQTNATPRVWQPNEPHPLWLHHNGRVRGSRLGVANFR